MFSRRDFMKLLGTGALVGTGLPGCSIMSTSPDKLMSIPSSFEDKLLLADGLKWKLLVKEGDLLAPNVKFGANNDYIQFFPLTSRDHGILWVNNEYFSPLLSSKVARTKDVIDKEMDLVGGTLIEIKRNDDGWRPIWDSAYNRSVTAKTKIPFAGGVKIAGSDHAIGTLANCAGGKTPWDTVLTCEENFDMFYGEHLYGAAAPTPSTTYGWEKFYPRPPEHYGWVVEVEPRTGKAKKLVSLGRFCHECATVRISASGYPVVYMGDDANDEHLYKFISSDKDSLEKGTLYVADLDKGQWVAMDFEDPRLKNHFKSPLEVLIYCREAAKILGATPLDRPEDIEIDPIDGSVLVALTNNKPKMRPMGSIMKIRETGNDSAALTFKHETYLTGGDKTGFACPDNLAFDPNGNLWITSDMSASDMGKGALQGFGNNALFVVLRNGPQAGIPFKMASAPKDAEFTGPLFSEDGRTLFLSVQHPGETTTDLEKPTSTWPEGFKPRSAVVTITGPLLENISGT